MNKNKLNNHKKLRLFFSLTNVVATCLATPVQGKPPHRGGSGGGLPYPTASTVSQLIADINYANSAGGAVTINLAAGATFNLASANNSIDGGNGLPVIAVNLTLIGNGATIQRTAVIGKYSIVKNPFRLFEVATGASLTLDHVTVKGGWSGPGGAVLNRGALQVVNGSTLSGNSGGNGGGVYNDGGTVTVSNSTLSGNQASGFGGGIYNAGGTVMLSDCAVSSNYAFSGGGVYNNGGTMAISASDLSGSGARFGGGIYNNLGTVTISNSSVLSNLAWHADYPWSGGNGGGIYNADILTVSSSTLSGNSADPNFGSGGGIYNDAPGVVTVEDSSDISGNTAGDSGADVSNGGVLYLDGASRIRVVSGNAAIAMP